ncbi:MAG TPA: DUF1634 domain-containing protein [Bryobacteraceae bacterium]
MNMERLLAVLLRYGAWLASLAIGIGLVLALTGSMPAGMRIITIGIGLFILLPSLRVLLMLAVFVRERDYRFGLIAALVLAIIVLGLVVGMHTPEARPA